MNIFKRRYINKLIIPIAWHIIYLLFSSRVDKSIRVYYDLVFYLGLSLYFWKIKAFSFSSLFGEWKKGKKFWVPVLITLLATIAAYGAGMVISALLPNIDDGINVFRVTDLPSLLAFILTTIILPPIAEESFYRKGIIKFDNRIVLTISSIFGIFLFASVHSLKLLGLIISAIWAVPFTIAYIKTRNIYIPVTAHFISNLAMNGITSIIIATKIF